MPTGVLTVDINQAIVLLVGVVGVKILYNLVDVLFAKYKTSRDHLSKEEFHTICESRRSRCSNTLTKKVDAIAKVTLAMAVKMNIDVKDIEGLL